MTRPRPCVIPRAARPCPPRDRAAGLAHAARCRVGRAVRFIAALCLIPWLAAAACAERVQRENVLATTQSMIGVQLAQNPTTQIYEVKAGFARNELFYVPTSKRVVYSDDGQREAAGAPGADPERLEALARLERADPSMTPEVLAEIQVGGTGRQTLGGAGEQGAKIEVYQRLAVGKLAVNAPAAIALLANDAATARAVAGAAPPIIESRDFVPVVRLLIDTLKTRSAEGDADAAGELAGLDAAADRVLPARRGFRWFQNNGGGAFVTTMRPGRANADLVTDRSAQAMLDYLAELDSSIRAVDEMLASSTSVTLDGQPVAIGNISALKRERDEQIAHRQTINQRLAADPAIRALLAAQFAPPAGAEQGGTNRGQ